MGNYHLITFENEWHPGMKPAIYLSLLRYVKSLSDPLDEKIPQWNIVLEANRLKKFVQTREEGSTGEEVSLVVWTCWSEVKRLQSGGLSPWHTHTHPTSHTTSPPHSSNGPVGVPGRVITDALPNYGLIILPRSNWLGRYANGCHLGW